jgi:hypothetical protein
MPQQPEPNSEAASHRMRDEVERLRRDLELLDDPETICSFGQMAFDGDGVEQDYIAAANWFRIAAERGNSRAQHNLALMYENGEGVPKDCSQAAKWYHMAAEQGNPGSQNNLGSLYETGEGVTQDHAVALEWYRRAAEGGATNAPANYRRLKPRIEMERHQNIASAFTDLLAVNSPLIGDCSLLPHPKAAILYAIKFVVDDYETKRESATDRALIDSYDRMIAMLNYALTCLTRDWQDIAPEDKDAVARLAACESFPGWALPLKQKYIDEERASREAAEAAFRVMKDRADFEMAEEDYDYTINANNWIAHLTPPELAHWESKPQSEKDWWCANTKPEDRGRILRTEIGAKASYNEFLHLPEATRNVITKRLEKQADEARMRLRQRGFAAPDQAPKAGDETPAA